MAASLVMLASILSYIHANSDECFVSSVITYFAFQRIFISFFIFESFALLEPEAIGIVFFVGDVEVENGSTFGTLCVYTIVHLTFT